MQLRDVDQVGVRSLGIVDAHQFQLAQWQRFVFQNFFESIRRGHNSHAQALVFGGYDTVFIPHKRALSSREPIAVIKHGDGVVFSIAWISVFP